MKPHYEPADMRIGLRVMAPVKRADARRLEDGEVVWVSKDRLVVEVQTFGRHVPLRRPFAVSSLRRPGTKVPEGALLV